MVRALAGSDAARTYTGTISAYLAYKRGAHDLAAQRIREIGGDINGDGLYIVRATDQDLAALVLPLSDKAVSARARAAVDREQAGDWEGAVGLWRKVLSDVPENDPLLRDAVRDRLLTARWRVAFDAGEWVDLGFDGEMTGWRTINGVWEHIDERTVRTRRGRSFYQLCPGLDLGQRYEIEARVTLLEEPSPSFRYGLAFAANLRRTDTTRVHRGFMIHPGDGVMRYSWMWGERDHARPTEISPYDPHVLRVVHDTERVRCYLDDDLVFDLDLINPGDWDEPPESRAGIGGFGVGGGTPVEFSFVRVRKLPPA